ncbi:HXXEE domain-containing protein [Brevibacillus borstelensis]|uniref:HXXEE domain-containing protein n=1 Tax=Brevibacillus borstelensis TaxID=45462 RepID=UPI0030BA88F1
MIAWLDSIWELSDVLWLLPIAFICHDLEEIITVEKWLAGNRERVVSKLPPKAVRFLESSLSMNTAQFAAAVACIFLVISSATLLAATTLSTGVFLPFYLVCVHVMFLHVFTHLGQSFSVKSYTPGVVTAVLVVLPYSLYAYYRLLASGTVSWELLFSTLPFVLLIIPVLFSAHWLGVHLVKK